MKALLLLLPFAAGATEMTVNITHPTEYEEGCPTCIAPKLPLSNIEKTEIVCDSFVENEGAALPCPFTSIFVQAPGTEHTMLLTVPAKGATLSVKARTWATTTELPSNYTDPIIKVYDGGAQTPPSFKITVIP
jgi:hypothetical protein